MTHNRILYLSLAFAFFASVTAACQHNALQSWQINYLNKMSPQELQFTANFLYISYGIALVESKIRQFSTPILRLNQSVRTNVATYQNTTDDLAMLKTLLDRLSYVVGARTIYMETYNVCQNHYAQYATPTIQAALESIHQDAQTQLCAWADEQTATTSEQLKKTAKAIGESFIYLQGVSGFHNSLSNGEVPVEIPAEEKKNKSLIILDIILNSTPQFITATENLTNTFNESSDYAAQIVAVGADIYKQYYNVVHYLIMSPTFDKQYATTMFSMHDVLPEEYKTVLPAADQVFSHMLQTTKLYTQTEFVQ